MLCQWRSLKSTSALRDTPVRSPVRVITRTTPSNTLLARRGLASIQCRIFTLLERGEGNSPDGKQSKKKKTPKEGKQK